MEKFMEKEAIVKVETHVETVLDNLYIKPGTDSITIRTMNQYYDASGKVIRTNAAEEINLRDRSADEENPAVIEYTDFIAAAGIDIEKIKLALKARNAKEKI